MSQGPFNYAVYISQSTRTNQSTILASSRRVFFDYVDSLVENKFLYENYCEITCHCGRKFVYENEWDFPDEDLICSCGQILISYTDPWMV